MAKAIGYQAFSRIIRELAPDILGAFIGAIVDISIVKDGMELLKLETQARLQCKRLPI